MSTKKYFCVVDKCCAYQRKNRMCSYHNKDPTAPSKLKRKSRGKVNICQFSGGCSTNTFKQTNFCFVHRDHTPKKKKKRSKLWASLPPLPVCTHAMPFVSQETKTPDTAIDNVRNQIQVYKYTSISERGMADGFYVSESLVTYGMDSGAPTKSKQTEVGETEENEIAREAEMLRQRVKYVSNMTKRHKQLVKSLNATVASQMRQKTRESLVKSQYMSCS